MLESLQKLYDTSVYKSKLQKQDALFIYIALAILFTFINIYIFFIPDTGPDRQLTTIQSALNGEFISLFTILFFYIFLPFVYFSTRRGNLTIGGVGVIVLW